MEKRITLRYHFKKLIIIPSTGKNVEQWEYSHNADGSVN
jgi:hypothetical protein